MDLAENMIRLSRGAWGLRLLRQGFVREQKLYEELLVKTEELDKTENSMTFY